MLVHLSFGKDAILPAILHFILLCVSVQQGIFIFFICSSSVFLSISSSSSRSLDLCPSFARSPLQFLRQSESQSPLVFPFFVDVSFVSFLLFALYFLLV